MIIVEKRERPKSEDRKQELQKTMNLADTKRILFGLTSHMVTYHGSLIVRIDPESFHHGYICIQPASVNYRTPRYSKSDVYMLRDCLIDLMGARAFDTYSHPVNECYDAYTMQSEREKRKDTRRWLLEKLSQRLEESDYCLLDNAEFGVLLAKKVVADELRDFERR